MKKLVSASLFERLITTTFHYLFEQVSWIRVRDLTVLSSGRVTIATDVRISVLKGTSGAGKRERREVQSFITDATDETRVYDSHKKTKSITSNFANSTERNYQTQHEDISLSGTPPDHHEAVKPVHFSSSKYKLNSSNWDYNFSFTDYAIGTYFPDPHIRNLRSRSSTKKKRSHFVEYRKQRGNYHYGDHHVDGAVDFSWQRFHDENNENNDGFSVDEYSTKSRLSNNGSVVLQEDQSPTRSGLTVHSDISFQYPSTKKRRYIQWDKSVQRAFAENYKDKRDGSAASSWNVHDNKEIPKHLPQKGSGVSDVNFNNDIALHSEPREQPPITKEIIDSAVEFSSDSFNALFKNTNNKKNLQLYDVKYSHLRQDSTHLPYSQIHVTGLSSFKDHQNQSSYKAPQVHQLPSYSSSIISKSLPSADENSETSGSPSIIATNYLEGVWEPEDFTLQIKYTEPGDAGIYVCQVNTEPKTAQKIHLTVVGKTFIQFL